MACWLRTFHRLHKFWNPIFKQPRPLKNQKVEAGNKTHSKRDEVPEVLLETYLWFCASQNQCKTLHQTYVDFMFGFTFVLFWVCGNIVFRSCSILKLSGLACCFHASRKSTASFFGPFIVFLSWLFVLAASGNLPNII